MYISSFFYADRHEIFINGHIQMFLVEIWPRNGPISLFHISGLLKISQHVLQKSEVSKIKGYEMYIFFLCSMLSVRDHFYLPYLIVSGGKMSRGSCVHRPGSKHPICMSGKLVQAECVCCPWLQT